MPSSYFSYVKAIPMGSMSHVIPEFRGSSTPQLLLSPNVSVCTSTPKGLSPPVGSPRFCEWVQASGREYQERERGFLAWFSMKYCQWLEQSKNSGKLHHRLTSV